MESLSIDPGAPVAAYRRVYSSVGPAFVYCLALILTPLLSGGVYPEVLGVIAILLAVSGIWYWKNQRSWVWIAPDPWIAAGFLVLIGAVVFSLIPLPVNLVRHLSPEAVRLANAFPVPGVSPDAPIPLSISTARTLNRGWEIGLGLMFMWVGRWVLPTNERLWIRMLVAAVFLLCISEMVRRLNLFSPEFRKLIDPSGHGAGTMPNRSFFAGWILMTALILVGWFIRNKIPLRGARKGMFLPRTSFPGDLPMVAAAFMLALIFGVLTGSRGAIISFICANVVWIVLLRKRSRKQSRWMLWFCGLALSALVALPASEYLLSRIQGMGIEYKMQIWRDTLRIFAKFPFFGSGLGTFDRAFSHFKTFGGEMHFADAENDYFQLFQELGLIGGGAAVIVLAGFLRKVLRVAFVEPVREPELFFGSLAALAAFLIHACFDFVAAVPANLILAAAVCGYMSALAGELREREVPRLQNKFLYLSKLVPLLLVFAFGVMETFSTWGWNRALRYEPQERTASLARSLSLWPFQPGRQLYLLRYEVVNLKSLAGSYPREQSRVLSTIRGQIIEAIARDPYNWQMRLELAWLDITFFNRATAIAEAELASRLNPLQWRIPYEFARYVEPEDRDDAFELIKLTHNIPAEDLPRFLDLAAGVARSPDELWPLVPLTVDGLKALGNVALARQWNRMAVQAFLRLTNRTDFVYWGDGLLKAGRPDLVLALAPRRPTGGRQNLIFAKALLANDDYPGALYQAERALIDSPSRREFQLLLPSVEGASRTADSGYDYQSRAVLAQAAALQPNNLHLQWLLYRIERQEGDFKTAAETAVKLAEKVYQK